MGRLFGWDSPMIQFLNKVADFLLLNVLVLFSSIPLFTIGAAQAALYDVIGRMKRREDCLLWKGYWRAFRSNFKQATVLWLVFLAGGLLIAFAMWFYLAEGTNSSKTMLIIVGFLALFWLGGMVWVFPLQSRFSNTIKNTFINAFHCAVFQFPKTVIAVALHISPMVLLAVDYLWFMRLGLFWICLWLPVCAYITMLLFNKPICIMVEKISLKQD